MDHAVPEALDDTVDFTRVCVQLLHDAIGGTSAIAFEAESAGEIVLLLKIELVLMPAGHEMQPDA